MKPEGHHLLAWTMLSLVGVALVLGGGSLAVNSYDRMGTCGDYDLSVEQVPDAEVADPGDYEEFSDLSAQQQAAFERALDEGGETLADGSLEYFGNVEYEGDYYRVRPITRVCDFSPSMFVWIGVAITFVGLVPLGWVGLWRRRVHAAPERES